jgi:predicted dehydrogenase
VYVATPVFLHAPQAIAAMRAGRHVLCEKPMALNYAEAHAMQQASEDTRRTLGIAYYRRMYPKVDRARELIEAGVIGRPVFAEATSHDWFNPLGTSRAWLADPKQSGGGPLRDIGSHRIDLMNYLFGKPINATGHMSTLVQPLEVEDNATVMIEYEGGVRGVVDVRWHSRVVRDEFRVRGTQGEIDLSPLNGPELVHPGGVERIAAPENPHYPCVEDFVNAIVRGILPRSYGESALAAEWVMEQVAG